MIRLYPEQLQAQLDEGLCAVYLLAGNEPLLLQESQDAIRNTAKQCGFDEHHTVQIDATTDWQDIFSICQSLSLFARRQTLTLILPENGPNASISAQLETLVSLLHDDLLLIIRVQKLTKAQENAKWFTQTSSNCVMITCQTPEQSKLPRWVSLRAKQMNLSLDDAARQLLCYCYEGNLLALSQALERLSLIWPDGKLTLPRVEQAVNDATHFTPFHWVDALLSGKSKRALHILQQLHQQSTDLIILLRSLQRELLMLVYLKQHSETRPLRTLFDQQKVWQSRRPLVTETLNRMSMQQLYQSVRLLTQTELSVKQDYNVSAWSNLESLSLLMCHHGLPDIFTHE